MVEVTKKIMKLKNIPSGLRIVHFSDLHINRKNIAVVDECVDKINRLKSDIVIFTGDAICHGSELLKELHYHFKKIECSLGKYYCLGNHDYSDGDNSFAVQKVFRSADFSLLCNNFEQIMFKHKNFYIAGLDDIEKGRQEIQHLEKIKDSGSIWAVHNPVNFKEISANSPSLVLSGHTHGVQIRIPFSEKIYQNYLKSPFLSGIYKEKESFLYVNRGIGQAVFDFCLFQKNFSLLSPRINSSPEITLIKTTE